MFLDDKLVQRENDLKKMRERRLFPDENDDESDEEWFMYAEREKQPYFNKDRGVFEHTDKKAINNAPNVFDATAVFKTGDDPGGIK